MKPVRNTAIVLLAVLLMIGFAGCMHAGSYANENPMIVRSMARQ